MTSGIFIRTMGHGQGTMWLALLLFLIQVDGMGAMCEAKLSPFSPYPEGSKGTFTCSIDNCQNYTGPDPNVVTWFKDGSSITEGVTSSELPNNGTRSTLVLTVDKSDNNDVLECRSPDASSVSNRLNITYKPVITILPTQNPYIVLESARVTLDCRTSDSNPQPTSYAWTYKNNTQSKNSILKFTPNRVDAGVYQCSVSNSIGTTQAEIELQVQYGPTSVSLSPGDVVYDLTEGIDELPRVSCSAVCNPECTYEWDTTDSAVLDLGEADRRDTDIHTCRASNTIRSASVSIKVTVKYPPDIAYMGTYLVEEGETTQLRCRASGVPGNYIYYEWYHVSKLNGSRLQTGNLTSNGSVYLRNLSYMHNGVYYCSVSNGVTTPEGLGVITGRMEGLMVVGPPHGLQSLYTKTANIGAEVTFLVDFFQFSRRDITVKWYNVTSGETVSPGRGNITLENADYNTNFFSTDVTIDGYRIMARIAEITTWDFGYYVVHLQSTEQKRVIHLRVDREGVSVSAAVNGWLVSTILLLIILTGCVLVAGVWLYRRGMLPRCAEKEKDTPSEAGNNEDQNYSDTLTVDALTYDPSAYTPLQVRRPIVAESPYSNLQSESEHTYESLKAKDRGGQGLHVDARGHGTQPGQELSSVTAEANSMYQNINITTESHHGNKEKRKPPPKPKPKSKQQKSKKPKNYQNTTVHSNGAFLENDEM